MGWRGIKTTHRAGNVRKESDGSGGESLPAVCAWRFMAWIGEISAGWKIPAWLWGRPLQRECRAGLGEAEREGSDAGLPPPPHYLLLLLFSLRLSFIFVLRPRAPNPPSCLKKGMLFALLFLVCFAFFPSTLLSECCCSMGCRGSVSHCPPSEPPHFGAVGLCPLGLLCWLFFPSPFFFPLFSLFFSPPSPFSFSPPFFLFSSPPLPIFPHSPPIFAPFSPA